MVLMVSKATRSLACGIAGTMLAIYLKTTGVHELAIPEIKSKNEAYAVHAILRPGSTS